MNKLFKFIKIFLISLIGVAILNDLGAYAFVAIVAKDISDLPYVSIEVLAFLLSAFLIYKDKIFGDFLMCILSLWSLQTSIQLNHALFAKGLLKIGPQVFFSNVLMLIIVVICIMHFLMVILGFNQFRGKGDALRSDQQLL